MNWKNNKIKMTAITPIPRTSEIRSCKDCKQFNDNCGTIVDKFKLLISAITCSEFKRKVNKNVH